MFSSSEKVMRGNLKSIAPFFTKYKFSVLCRINTNLNTKYWVSLKNWNSFPATDRNYWNSIFSRFIWFLNCFISVLCTLLNKEISPIISWKCRKGFHNLCLMHNFSFLSFIYIFCKNLESMAIFLYNCRKSKIFSSIISSKYLHVQDEKQMGLIIY